MKVAIIDYGMGNVASVDKAVKYLGHESLITNKLSEIESSDFIILPGVGAFAQGMENLKKLKLIDILNNEVIIKKKPFLGICLGMQLIATTGYEIKETNGLNWINGQVLKIEKPNLIIPHMGWNELIIKENSFFSDFNNIDFYFIHSYYFNPFENDVVHAVVNYGFDITAILKKGNIFATQFHPEKSQKYGLELLKFIFNYYA